MNLSKTTIVSLILSILIVIGASMYFLNDFAKRIEIPNEKIQSAINEKMPFRKEIFLGEVSISKAKVDLNNSIKITTEGLIEGAGREIPFSAESEGTVRYSSGSFYFVPSSVKINLKEVEVVETESIKSKLFSKASDISKKVGINKSNVEEKVSEILKNKLGDIPLYTLDAGIISASLKNVSIQKNSVIVELSLIELTKSILIGLVVIVLVLGLLIAVVRGGGASNLLDLA